MSDQAYLTSKNKPLKEQKDYQQIKDTSDHDIDLQDSDLNRGDETYDWMEAKAEIDNLLQNSKSPSELLKKSEEISAYWQSVRDQRKRRTG